MEVLASYIHESISFPLLFQYGIHLGIPSRDPLFTMPACSVAKLCLTVLWPPWTVVHQAPLFMGFPKQEYWSGCHFLLQGIFLTQESNPHLWLGRLILYPLSHQGSSLFTISGNKLQFSASVGKGTGIYLHRFEEGLRDPNSQFSIPAITSAWDSGWIWDENGFLAFPSLGLGFSFSGWVKSTHSLLSSLQTSATIASSPFSSLLWVSGFSKILW